MRQQIRLKQNIINTRSASIGTSLSLKKGSKILEICQENLTRHQIQNKVSARTSLMPWVDSSESFGLEDLENRKGEAEDAPKVRSGKAPDLEGPGRRKGFRKGHPPPLEKKEKTGSNPERKMVAEKCLTGCRSILMYDASREKETTYFRQEILEVFPNFCSSKTSRTST